MFVRLREASSRSRTRDEKPTRQRCRILKCRDESRAASPRGLALTPPGRYRHGGDRKAKPGTGINYPTDLKSGPAAIRSVPSRERVREQKIVALPRISYGSGVGRRTPGRWRGTGGCRYRSLPGSITGDHNCSASARPFFGYRRGIRHQPAGVKVDPPTFGHGPSPVRCFVLDGRSTLFRRLAGAGRYDVIETPSHANAKATVRAPGVTSVPSTQPYWWRDVPRGAAPLPPGAGVVVSDVSEDGVPAWRSSGE